MISTPEVVESAAQLVAYVHVTVPRAGVMAAMQAGLKELGEVLQAQKIVPAGPWFTHHIRRPHETFDFRICIPVNAVVAQTGRVYPGVMEPVQVARTVYSGNYDGLGKAWGEFMAWIDEKGYETREDLWERYVVGPDTSARPEEWRTELNRPLA
ncbi:MAG: GyrI-like domain-containing protein [Acidobacteria bacterium]|nr:GyrI-like domain-containing protein [Acidobacteriota bacterium]